MKGEHLGIEPFRMQLQSWLARGWKRQRLEQTSKLATQHLPQASNSVLLPAASRPPKGIPPKPPPRQTPPPRALTGGSAKPPQPKTFALQNSTPIHAELLQKRLQGLKKVEDRHGPKDMEEPIKPSDNLVLRRLQDRRALVADDTDELTQCTSWSVADSGGSSMTMD